MLDRQPDRISGMRAMVAMSLAALQAMDLVVTSTSPRYGDAHLNHLGVPKALRPVLPVAKASAVVALVASARRPRARSLVGLALVPYYAAAVTFHVRSGDDMRNTAPAAACAVMAAMLV